MTPPHMEGSAMCGVVTRRLTMFFPAYFFLQNLFGLMEAEAVSSGYTLGSCNWLLRCNGVKMVYLSASSLLTTHAEVSLMRILTSYI